MTTILWFVFQFQSSQETYFKTTRDEFSSLEKESLMLQEHLNFINTHEKELNFLIQKGWFAARNRLIAGEFLNKQGHSLNEFHFTFDPETATTLEEKYHFKVTKMTIEGRALFDIPFYNFLENLLTTFPGVLRPLEFSLTRGEEINAENLNFMAGKLVIEWFTMGDNSDAG